MSVKTLKHISFAGMADARGKMGALISSRCVGRQISIRVSPTRNGRVVRRGRWEDVGGSAEGVQNAQRRVLAMIKRNARKLNLLAEGCHAKWVDSKTGSTLTLRNAEDYETDPSAGRYFLICEDHASCVGVDTKALGRSSSGLDFCDDCREAHEKRTDV